MDWLQFASNMGVVSGAVAITIVFVRYLGEKDKSDASERETRLKCDRDERKATRDVIVENTAAFNSLMAKLDRPMCSAFQPINSKVG